MRMKGNGFAVANGKSTARFINSDTAARLSRVQSERKIEPRTGEMTKAERFRLLSEMDARSWAKRKRLEADE